MLYIKLLIVNFLYKNMKKYCEIKIIFNFFYFVPANLVTYIIVKS